MLFHTLQFWVFFAVVLIGFYSLPLRMGRIGLLGASYFFYIQWDARFAALILASTIIDYVLGISISRGSPRRKRILLILSICANLGILGFFKYYNFFAATFANLIGLSGDSLLLRIIL